MLEPIPLQPLAPVTPDARRVLPEELLSAMDVHDALSLLMENISAIEAALKTKRPIDPRVQENLAAFFDESSDTAHALRKLADELARTRILAERRSEKPRGPKLVA